MKEPSVLDYLKSIIAPWKYPKVTIPDLVGDEVKTSPEIESSGYEGFNELIEPAAQAQTDDQVTPISTERSTTWFWLTFGAIGIAILAQLTLEPSPGRTWIPGVVLYAIAIALVSLSYLNNKLIIPGYRKVSFLISQPSIRVFQFAFGVGLSVLVFMQSEGNRFTLASLLLLVLSVIMLSWSYWQPGERKGKLRFSPWTALVLGVLALAAFFRFYLIDQVPPEMNSDHAEKILDVLRVLDGQTMIFFPNNGGREALQFYLVAALHKIFNLELNFTALKIVTISAGFLSLPFLYLLGKELIDKRVGLVALAFGAIAYWPNVVSRVGMRLPFYILFTAALLYFLMRGLRSGRRNYFIFSGITLGISLYGYSANRILPLVVLLAVILFLLHNSSKGRRRQIIVSTLVLFVIAAAIAMPMLRYAIEEPDSLLFRTLTRMGTMERPIEGSPIQIFFTNLGKALIMFSWDNGEIWPVSVPHRPALDVISAALFWIGASLVLIRYIRSKEWLDLFWLLSIPILMLPSVMSLAFPAENPSLYRTGGVMIPVFIIMSIAMDGLMSTIRDRHAKIGPHLAWFVLAIFLCVSAFQNFKLVFKDYYEQYRAAAWNSSEMAEVVNEFENTSGSVDTVWVMAYPHWVDTRLIGIITGHPLRNFVLFPEQVDGLPESTSAKLFMIKPDDETSLNILTSTYPSGILEEFTSEVESKNFLIYYVPQQPDNPSN